MDFTGKHRNSMVYVEPMGIDSDNALSAWIKLALTYVVTLPPKKSVTR